MLMFVKKAALFLLLATGYRAVSAQEQFTEGVITYHITITGRVPTDAGEPALTETKSGKLTIYIKDDNIRQDILLEDGYSHSRISNYTTGKEIILQTVNTLKYAIEVNLKDYRKKNAAYYNAAFEPGQGQKQWGNYELKEGRLRYRDGSSFSFYYLDTYELRHPEIFERTPEIRNIPALYDLPMSNGFNTRFELEQISPEPVSLAVFRVPEGYRIISRKEYDKLMK